MPGGLICFNESQIDLFHNQFVRETPEISCLYINCFKESSYVNTTMNSQKLYFYEMFTLKLDKSRLNINKNTSFCGEIYSLC